MICEICNNNEARYCCPLCQKRICSVGCSKYHKDTLGCKGKKAMGFEPRIPIKEIDEKIVQHDAVFLNERKSIFRNIALKDIRPTMVHDKYLENKIKSLGYENFKRAPSGMKIRQNHVSRVRVQNSVSGGGKKRNKQKADLASCCVMWTACVDISMLDDTRKRKFGEENSEVLSAVFLNRDISESIVYINNLSDLESCEATLVKILNFLEERSFFRTKPKLSEVRIFVGNGNIWKEIRDRAEIGEGFQHNVMEISDETVQVDQQPDSLTTRTLDAIMHFEPLTDEESS
eukprot:GHVP01040527.1.p1 GENE.GHVP01040527.1~~GHVP01040527.1.p1  ORF type:complete len:288 (-),score=54.01 GHVP01040527.1:155-1018(-)